MKKILKVMLVIGIFLTLGTVLSTSSNYVYAGDDTDIVLPNSPRPMLH